jgi:hypothetical protein
VVRRWQIVVVCVLLLVAVTVYLGRDQLALARIGSGFAAKQTCSCLHVSGRPLASCMKDFDADAARWLSWQVGDRSVTVSALGLFSSTSVFNDGFGCHVSR